MKEEETQRARERGREREREKPEREIGEEADGKREPERVR
jgi:hypothetical protein